MVVNDFVPGVEAAVRREVSVRPPLTSLLPARPVSWTDVFRFQNESCPSRVDAAT